MPSLNSYQNAFQQAWAALMERKAQTFLSISGVCVGVAAVICLSMITESGRSTIFKEFETYGLNSIWVYRNWNAQNPDKVERTGSGITTDNLKMFDRKCCPSVINVSPIVYLEDWMRLLRAGNNAVRASVQGVGEKFFAINSDEILEGRGFSQKDIINKRKVAVIGPKTKALLFGGHQSAMGKYIRVDGQRYKVIGVLRPKSRSILSALGATGGEDINNRFITPYTTYQTILGTKDVHTLIAEARSEESLNSAVKEIEKMLLRTNNNRFQYQLDTMTKWIETANEILSMVTIVGFSAAMISLLVGGIGIFNVMTSSVRERTREIGIRKAIGARNSDILRQFLFEATVIGGMGALLGVLLSFLVGVALFFIADLVFEPSWVFVSLAVIAAMIIAIFSGVRPANRAAHMRPAVALRVD